MAIFVDPGKCARQHTLRLEETLVRDLRHLALTGNPSDYQHTLEILLAEVRNRFPKREEMMRWHVDDVTSQAVDAIGEAGGTVLIGNASGYEIVLPQSAILCSMPLADGRQAYCLNEGRDHLVIGPVNPDTEYYYEGCEVIQ